MIDPRRGLYPQPQHDPLREPDEGTSHALMLDMIGVGKRVLELGCSNGYMSRHLKQRNCQVTGIEVDPLAAAEARAYCEEVIVADLDTRPLVDLLPGTPFDVAVFGDVLEHLRDPWRVFDEARAFLAPASFVVLSIPNIAHGSVRLALLRGEFDYQPQGLLDSTHLRFFTLRSIRELCMRGGYRIEEIRRTKADIFTVNELLPRLDPGDFDDELIAKLRSDPEHDTVQFIIKAVPLSDAERVSDLVARICSLDSELQAAREKGTRLQTELDSFHEEMAGLVALNNQLSVERSAAESQERELNALREAVAGIDREDAERREEIGDLTAALAASQIMRDQLSADLRHQETRIDELEAVRAELAQTELRCSSLRADLAAERERASEAAVVAEAEHQALDGALRRLDELALAVKLGDMALSKEKEERANFEAGVARLHMSAIEQTRTELHRILEEIALTDAAIHATYNSKLWALKRLIGGLRQRPRRKKA